MENSEHAETPRNLEGVRHELYAIGIRAATNVEGAQILICEEFFCHRKPDSTSY